MGILFLIVSIYLLGGNAELIQVIIQKHARARPALSIDESHLRPDQVFQCSYFLGIAAAAQALDLDFVPLFDEQYDLVIPSVYYQSDLLAPLLDLLQEPAFRSVVAGMPGYDISRMGSLVAEF